ncbi:MAG: 2,3-bisphosphoglycerate-independent phosphoglycerate mutase [Candidatus Uhrbacteria bacterium]|nr:2,3-bisphosphoglycerate-independent phosphoglycerate mutase [Candidatus Uhrbacteria bacterium]
MSLTARPIVLIVLDGFGIAPPDNANAITLAHTPFITSLFNTYPSMLLEASGLNVGLPRAEVGNSEVGHLTIGSGILRYQSLPRIDRSIEDGEFAKLPELEKIRERVAKGGKLHLVGLIGNGGVHSSQQHLRAMIDWTKSVKIWKQTFLHAFLDGRDTAKDTGMIFLKDVMSYMKDEGHLATIGGRYWGMDRNMNWDRIQKAYDAMVFGKADVLCQDPVQQVQASYDQKVYDEEMSPFVLTDKAGAPIATIDEGDTVLYFNFRADRGRQLTEALVEKEFPFFERKPFTNLSVTTFVEYKKGMPVDVLYPPEIVTNPMSKIFSDHGLRQLHIAETEKYAHVTFFLNGMQEKPYPGEDRILVPSPAVPSYDMQPEMSGFEVTQKVVEAIESGLHDFIVINYANPDMVGHTGSLEACVKAVEATDQCLSRVVTAATSKGGTVFIVGDHGNAEMLINPITGEADKEHNFSPVPFIIVGNEHKGKRNSGVIDNDPSMLQPVGILADVAPTILSLAGLPIPPEMTGTRLF